MQEDAFPRKYKIVIQGQLNDHWAHWFDGLHINSTAAGETVLSGPIQDQAALYGILNRLRDLGLTLVLVTRLDKTTKHENINRANKRNDE